MGLFGHFSYLEFSNAMRTSVFAFNKGKPPAGFEPVRLHDLGIDQQGIFFTSPNGRGKAVVVSDGNELIVGFRGTDKSNDIRDYDNISFAKNYVRQFEPLLRKVADYARDNDLHVTFTGASLGGAVTNIVADRAHKRWGGAFEEASFIAISSPYISNSRQADLINFGFSNDIVYHIVPGSWDRAEKANALPHIFLYQNHRFFRGNNLDDRVSVHKLGNYSDAIAALGELYLGDGRMLVDALKPNSYVIFDNTREEVNGGQVRPPKGKPLIIIGEDRPDKLNGAAGHKSGSHEEWIFGRGGNDRIIGRQADDQLYGGEGNDRLIGGKGRDYLSGGPGRDQLYLEDDGDVANGGEGQDRFIVRNVLPRNDNGVLSAGGNDPPRFVIEDFVRGSDVLDLRRIDGNLERRGDQPLFFAGYHVHGESEAADDLERGLVEDARPGSVTLYLDRDGNTHVLINRDTDAFAEMDILLLGDVGNIARDILL